jgi:hypothetical protein
MDRGYIKNLEDRKGRPAQLVPGEPLPEDLEVLPAVERLQGCMVARDSEGVKKNFFSESSEEPSEEKPEDLGSRLRGYQAEIRKQRAQDLGAGQRNIVSTPPEVEATVQHLEEKEETDEHGWNCLCEECLPV